MARFTPEDVLRLSRLARLELSTDEITLFARQLSEILTFADAVQRVERQPRNPGEAPATRLREDTVEPSLSRDDVLDAAPAADRAAGFFTVPRVFTE